MLLTLILSLCVIGAILLMLYSAVALIQDKRLFVSARVAWLCTFISI